MRSVWLVFATLFLFLALSTVWYGNHNLELFVWISLAVLCLPGIFKRRKSPA